MSYVFKAIQLPEPKIQFFQCLPQVNPRNIYKCKPFSYEFFAANASNNEITLKVITEADYVEQAGKFIEHLIYGIGKRPYFGFSNIFGVNIDFDINNDIKTTTSQDLNLIVKEVVDELYGSPSIICIIGSSELISPNYKSLKAEVIRSFSHRGVRLQFIRRDTIESFKGQYGYEFILLNIATAIYAKCGGVPWKLADPTLVTTGLIIGIAFHRKRSEDKARIYYGSIQLLDEYGDHLYTRIRMYHFEKGETEGLYIPYNIMKDIMMDILRNFKKVPLIIVHKSAPFVEDEDARGIRDAINDVFGNEKPFYALIHIKRNIIYRGYDLSATDVSIKRGLLLVNQDLNNKHILFTTGRTNSSRRKLGTPKPLELYVYENNSPLNATEISEQVLALTKLDWNTTEMEIRSPITLKYSTRAARLAPYLLSESKTDMQIGDIRDLM